MICPRCDEQGLIYEGKVVNLGIRLYICDECEACWNKEQIISIKTFKDLTIFLEEHGLTYENSIIENLGYLDFNNDKRKRAFFRVEKNEIIALIDEAWLKRENHLPDDAGAYLIDMEKIIGTNGETAIKIIVKPGTAEIRTAYPVKLKTGGI